MMTVLGVIGVVWLIAAVVGVCIADGLHEYDRWNDRYGQ